MKQADIDQLPVEDSMPAATRLVRKSAPRLIASVIDDTMAIKTVASIEELRPEHIEALAGGVDAATYLVSLPSEKVIIKLSESGLNAEAEALTAWKQRYARVPKVIQTGIVPTTKNSKHPVQYLVQEALLDDDGRLVETCANYLTREPQQAREVGRQLGFELNKMHSAISQRGFGEFSDSAGSGRPYATWNGYVADALRVQRDYMVSNLGVTNDQVSAVLKFIKQHRFIKRGRYVHGDFSIRNIAVRSYKPLKLSPFDPNPLIGDPTWDVSFITNNYEYEKRRLEYDDSQHDLCIRNQQIWIGFKQGYKRQINQKSLQVAQLIQAVYQAQYRESRGDQLDFRVRKEFIADLIAQIAK